MTTQPQPEKITAAEIRELFADIRAELADLREELHTIREGLKTAAAPVPAAGTFAEMEISEIVKTYDDSGKPSYKAKGAPYQKFGVRVWDEILPALDIDPATLNPGPNALPAPIRARVLMAVNESGQQTPRKVIGKA